MIAGAGGGDIHQPDTLGIALRFLGLRHRLESLGGEAVRLAAKPNLHPAAVSVEQDRIGAAAAT